MFQKYNLLPTLTAADNIAIARHIAGSKIDEDPNFREILDMLGISGRLKHKPRALSGGEQQRVAIARAIVNHPAILLADEPTGNLDTENSNTVLGLLRDLNERLGQTILMITHNPEAAAYGHRTVHMRDGRSSREGFASPRACLDRVRRGFLFVSRSFAGILQHHDRVLPAQSRPDGGCRPGEKTRLGSR